MTGSRIPTLVAIGVGLLLCAGSIAAAALVPLLVLYAMYVVVPKLFYTLMFLSLLITVIFMRALWQK